MNDIEPEISRESEDLLPEITPELSRLIKIEHLKGDHFELAVNASDEERVALAARFGLLELENLTAQLKFTFPASKSNIHVEGHFEAEIVQPCVVTLEPVPASVKGEFHCDYSPEILPEDVEIIEFDKDTEDPAEPIIDGVFDIGIMLTEQFGLELDPFPRAPGADFDEIKKATKGKLDTEDSNNPFAVLKKLK